MLVSKRFLFPVLAIGALGVGAASCSQTPPPIPPMEGPAPSTVGGCVNMWLQPQSGEYAGYISRRMCRNTEQQAWDACWDEAHRLDEAWPIEDRTHVCRRIQA